MDSSRKGHFQASNSLKSSASLRSSFSGENNENDDIKQDVTVSSKSQNSGKHFRKHFVSPTLSASSKAIIVSRKKVLGEKNESVSSFDVHFQNSQKECQLLRTGRGQGTSQYSVRSSSEAFSASDSTDEFNTSVSAADSLSVMPYDPLTNYLSPRPKYLRYKPNRHQEMLNRQWRHNRKEEFMKSTVDSINSFEDFLDDPSYKVTPSVPNLETANDSGFHDDEEEMEEEEEEEEGEEEEEEDELEEKRCSLKGVLKIFLSLVFIGLCTPYMFSENSPMQLQGLKDGCYISLNHSSEAIPKNLLCAGDGMIMCPLVREAEVGIPEVLKNQQSSHQDLGKEAQIVVEESSNDDDINVRRLDSLNEQNSDIISVTEVDKSDTILDNPVLLNVEETADCKELDIEQMDSDLTQQEFAENMIVDDGEMDLMDNPGVTEQDFDMVQKPDNVEENFMENAGEELNSNSGLEETADKAGDDEIVEVESERPVIGEAWLELMMARLVELVQIHIASIAFFFSIFAIVLASSSALVYYYIINHPRTPCKAFSQPDKTETAQLEEEKSQPLPQQPYREIECLQKKLESISLKPSTMTFSLEEIRKDLSYISQSPKVESLGEVAIGGGKVSCTIKTNNEAEEESVTPQSDTASTDSPSYGSFTAEKKILKKQGARDGSVQMITTPVRRSSRLQNRCITPCRS